jgi:hypothetical protein
LVACSAWSTQRGVATVYTHEQLVRLRAITALRRRDRLRLDGVKLRLQVMSAAEIDALVAPPVPAPSAPSSGVGQMACDD